MLFQNSQKSGLKQTPRGQHEAGQMFLYGLYKFLDFWFVSFQKESYKSYISVPQFFSRNVIKGYLKRLNSAVFDKLSAFLQYHHQQIVVQLTNVFHFNAESVILILLFFNPPTKFFHNFVIFCPILMFHTILETGDKKYIKKFKT